MSFKFSIQIDDEKHSLTAERGISIQKLAEFLTALYEAIDLGEGSNCTLSRVRGNCYALDFNTQSESQYGRFKVVHKNLQEISPSSLNPSERKYQKTLNKLLGNNYYLRAYDMDKNVIATLKDFGEDKEIKYYYSQKIIYGIVSEIGGRKVDSHNKHIIIDGLGYRINISKEEDLQLKQYYRTHKLRLKVKLKKSLKNSKIISADLMTFSEVSGGKLTENLKKEGFIELEGFKGITTLDQIIEKIYEHKK